MPAPSTRAACSAPSHVQPKVISSYPPSPLHAISPMLPPLLAQRYAMQNPRVARKSVRGRVHKVGQVCDINTSLSYTLGLLALPPLLLPLGLRPPRSAALKIRASALACPYPFAPSIWLRHLCALPCTILGLPALSTSTRVASLALSERPPLHPLHPRRATPPPSCSLPSGRKLPGDKPILSPLLRRLPPL